MPAPARKVGHHRQDWGVDRGHSELTEVSHLQDKQRRDLGKDFMK